MPLATNDEVPITTARAKLTELAGCVLASRLSEDPAVKVSDMIKAAAGSG